MENRFDLDWKKLQDLMLQERIISRAVVVTNLILLGFLAYTLAGLTWRLFPEPEQAAPPMQVEAAARPAAQAQGAAGRWNIAQWHLFGAKPRGQPAAPVAVAPTRLPETKLNLVLRGVYASENPQAAGAIISEPNGKQGFFRVGARLPGGAVLKEVHTDRIILERRGRLETLRLPEEKINGAQRAGRQPPASFSRTTRAPVAPASREPTPREFRDLVVKDPQRLTDIVQMTPYSKQGRFIGYRIQPGRNRALFTQFGLQSGDIVTSINGISIDSPTNGLSVLRSLATARQVRIEVERNGVKQTLQLDLDQ